MAEVHIRVTHTDENMNKLAKWLISNTFCDILCFEVGKREEKRHFHALCRLTITPSTLRQQIHKVFFEKSYDEKLGVTKKTNIFGTTAMSISKLKKDKITNILYICKGSSLGCFEYFGGIITFEEATAYNRQFWETNQKISDTGEKNQKKKPISWSHKVKEEMLEKFPDDIQKICLWQNHRDDFTGEDWHIQRHQAKEEAEIATRKLFHHFVCCLGADVKKLDRHVSGIFAGILNSYITADAKKCKAYSDRLYDQFFKGEYPQISLGV